MLSEISEIKYFLFCRLLLGHSTLLPAALRADSVEAFLADAEVTEPALRDLSKMENSGVQNIRDTCADLFRGKEEADDLLPAKKVFEKSSDNDPVFGKPKMPRDALPKKWVSEGKKKRDQEREN